MRQITAIWAVLIAVVLIPVIAAGFSPYLAWRDPVYIAAGFAGVACLSLLLLQPLLAAKDLPGLTPVFSRHLHRWVGMALVGAIVIHVGGLWITSPPDVVDALTFTSPTPFSAWGVIAMWTAFAAAALGILRQRTALRFRVWRLTHTTLASVTIAGSIIHALLIEGTMEIMSKIILCVLIFLASARTLAKLRVWDVARR
ncbi:MULTISPECIES: ferric reductase-like transmembrane domain-containing protein [unclassified Ruegeria]|uniref:ferric reductase-like transmembrane domain-containing protein n=1 Tax=unclassified Ruegeria TaxID=2625375 RepID=UPI001ADD09EB|nr:MULTISPECIES: ferric reductase-like transmembrane domain-containing protein [unclassified Ruegeria]MBO9410107.1 ferric reductase-like transmembrane domain-containing protein [Ruegeria sp. R8_1]MBO9414674.1 ferric reductase-like transmembrane domain-containing protein [Ruegeria sp. R8_2]